MNIPLIQHRERIEETEHSRQFTDLQEKGCGYSFDCTVHGERINTNPQSEANFIKCLANPERYYDHGIVARVYIRRLPAVGHCPCGSLVTLDRFTNTCDCGADYDSGGSRLAPRSQWGEETGETYLDCL